MDDVVGEEAPAGWRTEQGVGFHPGFSRPRCTNGWADGMAVDEGRRAAAVDDVVGEESPVGRRSGGRRRSMGFRGFWRPRCMNGGRRGRGEPSLGTRLSEM